MRSQGPAWFLGDLKGDATPSAKVQPAMAAVRGPDLQNPPPKKKAKSTAKPNKLLVFCDFPDNATISRPASGGGIFPTWAFVFPVLLAS
jgi:hypothetical protein